MIVQISPAAKSVGESTCSLTWAQRVASVELGAAVKSVQASSSAAAADTRENQCLKSKVDDLQRSNKELQGASKKMEQQVQQLEKEKEKDEQKQQKKEQQHLQKEQMLQQQLQQQKEQLQKREQQLLQRQKEPRSQLQQPTSRLSTAPSTESTPKTPTKRVASMPKMKPRTEGRSSPMKKVEKKEKKKQSSFLSTKADAENVPHAGNTATCGGGVASKGMSQAQAQTELRAVYQKWCPEKLANGGVSIDALLSKWTGREALLIEKVTAKYAKEQTPTKAPLSPSKQHRTPVTRSQSLANV
jgi:myosin heavy subunit